MLESKAKDLSLLRLRTTSRAMPGLAPHYGIKLNEAMEDAGKIVEVGKIGARRTSNFASSINLGDG